ncbi:hypothetical protein PVK06_005206 [Gossypium arboreum]|uniref:Polygalacturonase-like n=1 Tax=Gossypium arboreum TaxID=29729 RepID=A0ABR0QU70_GOSAR|nr:hypothetical protein PVK06_005206 [Gossypium arboreum]
MLILVLLSISSVKVQGGGWGGVIDVVAKFGAKAGESATLDGPCKVPIQLQIEGTVKAPADPGAFKEPKWIAFNRIENFKLSGGGVFDSQGTTTYKREGCKGCKNIIFERFTVSAPDESPNTDGIHIGRSDGVNVLNLEIKTGDDCVSIADGSKNLVINGVTCGPRHEVVKIICSATLPCENVELADIEITHSGPTGPAVSQCLNVKPKVSGKQNPAACSAPIPAKPTPTA